MHYTDLLHHTLEQHTTGLLSPYYLLPRKNTCLLLYYRITVCTGSFCGAPVNTEIQQLAENSTTGRIPRLDTLIRTVFSVTASNLLSPSTLINHTGFVQ